MHCADVMPIVMGSGMHLLFCEGKCFDTYTSVEHLLLAQSVKREVYLSLLSFRAVLLIGVIGTEGQLYDQEGPGVLPHIQSFIETYRLSLDDLLVKDLTQYPVGDDPLCVKVSSADMFCAYRHSTHFSPVV
jgi:phosphatidylserine decarboxylase